MMRRLCGSVLALVLTACSESPTGLDASTQDATSVGGVDGGSSPDAALPNGGRVTVVFRVDMTGGLDRNCQAIRNHQWLDTGALEDPLRTAYIVGGAHERTPSCDARRTTHCLTESQRDELDEALGGWRPNRVAMRDDGLGGDTTAGDGIYTIVLELHAWDPAEAPDGAGVRIGYKYTWGPLGGLWTGTEEWPGNQRLLEVVDVNGDGVVVRQDIFGDETTNKDASNLLAPASGGCGVTLFEAEQRASPTHVACAMDSRENRIDTDGDCQLDAWAPGL